MLFVWIIVTVFVIAAAVTAAWAGWRAAPYVPTFQRDVARMMQLAEIRDRERVVDLGAGDGRIILTAVQQAKHVTGVGYELALGFWLLAWLRLAFSKYRRQASLRLQDFYHQDLSKFDVVFCFLTPKAMQKLEPKLQRELRPGARVISAVFPMPSWPLDYKEKPSKRVTVYRYVQK